MEKHDLLGKQDSEFIIRPWSSVVAEPIIIEKAHNCFVWDTAGNKYLDFTSGYFVNVAGHTNPAIVEAATKQLNLVSQVTMKQSSIPAIKLAEKLAQIAPGNLKKVFYTTGGSEAVEFALKMARCYTKKREIISLRGCYHGLTLGALSLCSNVKYRKTAYTALPGGVLNITNPYTYRWPHKEEDFAELTKREMETVLGVRTNNGEHDAAAIIVEYVQGATGVIAPQGWMRVLRKICDENNILLIVDEIQTGLGRTGKMFGCQHDGIVPDIMILGKGISGGVGSMGAVVTNANIAAVFNAGTTPTNAGNAVSCAAGLALIGELEKKKLPENASKVGEYLVRRLREIESPHIGDVRMKGLMGGIELVEDKETKIALSKEKMFKIKENLKNNGIIITISGLLSNFFRVQPPLTLTTAQADIFVDAFKKSLGEI